MVAFTSTASNIVNGDANNQRDAFVYDRQTGAAVDVSVDSNGVQGDLESSSPVLSADGKFVAYSSFADNLIPDDQNEGGDIFVRDLQANTTERVSEYTGHYEAEGDASVRRSALTAALSPSTRTTGILSGVTRTTPSTCSSTTARRRSRPV